jgi:hypothetical protein
MPDPVLTGDDSVPVENDSPGLQQWMEREYPLDPRKDERAKALRAENMRRFLAHLTRCPRAARVS